MEEKAKRVAELLKLLANENRLIILCALMEAPLSVGKLAEHLPGITQSALSQHLAVLKNSGILDFEKKGQTVTYSILDRRVEAVLQILKEQYCQ